MRDEQHADTALELVDGVGKAFGGVLVQRAGGFVEDQYFGALEQGAGDIQGAPTKTVRKNRLGGATTFTDDLEIE